MEEMLLNEEMPAGEMTEAPGEALFVPETPEETARGTQEPAGEEKGGEDLTEEEIAAWDAFQAEYPALTAENIPEDVFRLVSEGETPVHAMRQVELRQLKAENRALKQRLAAAENGYRNRVRTPGSMLGRASVPGDAFLEGLEL